MAEYLSGLLGLGAQTVQPQAHKIAVQFSHMDLQQLLINKLYAEATWLREYKSGRLINNGNGTFTVEFYK